MAVALSPATATPSFEKERAFTLMWSQTPSSMPRRQSYSDVFDAPTGWLVDHFRSVARSDQATHHDKNLVEVGERLLEPADLVHLPGDVRGAGG